MGRVLVHGRSAWYSTFEVIESTLSLSLCAPILLDSKHRLLCFNYHDPLGFNLYWI